MGIRVSMDLAILLVIIVVSLGVGYGIRWAVKG